MPPSFKEAYARGMRDSSGSPGKKYFQQKVDYVIEAAIDPAISRLSGSGTITLHNTTPDTLTSVALRLYQNYFTPRVQRTDYVTDITDGITVDRLLVNGSAVQVNDLDRYGAKRRVVTVTPPAPILPGATATIEAVWHFTVPAVDTTQRGERMGRFGNYLYQLAQWYPQVAMYDDMRGWDEDEYLGNAEFNNQFGSFDVKITAPGGWLLGATGALVNPEEVYSQRTRERLATAMTVDSTIHVVEASERGSGATAKGAALRWHFHAPLANDFAFAVSRDYVMDATHATIPGKGKIPVTALYLPQHNSYRTNNTVQYGARALEQHSRTLFPYDFPQGTIADGPETGMEYPMIIFNGSALGVTVHEFGHQWFPMMVGSNETRYGFMDEGLNEYIDAIAGARMTRGRADPQFRASGYLRVAGSETESPMMWLNEYMGPGSGTATYSKAPLALYALGAIVGDSAVQRALAAYAAAWKYKHPTPYDFFFSMNKSLGKNLDWFWYEWFFTTFTLDQGIQSVRVDGGAAEITIRDKGDLVMPAIVRIDFTDGTTGTRSIAAERWFPGSRTLTERIPLGGRTIRSVTIDPENRLPDLDRSNNVWPGR